MADQQRLLVGQLPTFPRGRPRSESTGGVQGPSSTQEPLAPDAPSSSGTSVARLKALSAQRKSTPAAPGGWDGDRAGPGPPELRGAVRHSIQTAAGLPVALTDGFHSPNKAQVMRETTQEEMRGLVARRQQQRRAAVARGSAADTALGLDADTAPHHRRRQPVAQAYDPDDDLQRVDQAVPEVQSAATWAVARGFAGSYVRAVPAALPTDTAALPDPQPLSASLDDMIRDVAARIIQAHWRAFRCAAAASNPIKGLPAAPQRPTGGCAAESGLSTTVRGRGSAQAVPARGPVGEATKAAARPGSSPAHRPSLQPCLSPGSTRAGSYATASRPARLVARSPPRSPTISRARVASVPAGVTMRAAPKGRHRVYTVEVPPAARPAALLQPEEGDERHDRPNTSTHTSMQGQETNTTTHQHRSTAGSDGGRAPCETARSHANAPVGLAEPMEEPCPAVDNDGGESIVDAEPSSSPLLPPSGGWPKGGGRRAAATLDAPPAADQLAEAGPELAPLPAASEHQALHTRQSPSGGRPATASQSTATHDPPSRGGALDKLEKLRSLRRSLQGDRAAGGEAGASAAPVQQAARAATVAVPATAWSEDPPTARAHDPVQVQPAGGDKGVEQRVKSRASGRTSSLAIEPPHYQWVSPLSSPPITPASSLPGAASVGREGGAPAQQICLSTGTEAAHAAPHSPCGQAVTAAAAAGAAAAASQGMSTGQEAVMKPSAPLPSAEALPDVRHPPIMMESSPASSLTSQKLHSILAFLDEVEQRPSTAGSAAAQAGSKVGPVAPVPVADPAAPSRGTSTINPALMRQVEPALREEASAGSMAGSEATIASLVSEPPTAFGGGTSTGAATQPAADRPASNLAQSVFHSVKSKMARLQEDVRQRDELIAVLRQELEGAAERTAEMLTATETRAASAVTAARAEHEAALARHLGFMDRLLADKDELNRKVAAMEEALKTAEERHERMMGKLKEGWAAELRRQREAWAAGEKAKRDAWVAAKTQEVKELTVRGLEGEVQKLLAQHKAELAAAAAAGQEEAARAVDIAAAQHELGLRQLRDRMHKEMEDALEKERAAAMTRLREASEAYEQQLSMQRLKLVAEGDARLEAAEAARREDRKRHEEALAQAAREAQERVRAVEEEARAERDALRRAHDKQLEALREMAGAEQEGWRAAVSERAKRELEAREAAAMERMARERDAQIALVVQRLESEAQEARETARREVAAKEAAIASRHAAALKEAKATEAKLLEQFRMAAEAHEAAEARCHKLQASLDAARREVETRGATIRWLEAQTAEAQAAEARHVAAGNEALQALVAEKQDLLAQLAAAQREVAILRARHAQEIDHVEARVKAALGRKDEALAAAHQQVAALTQQLRQTEAVLAAQQMELGAM